MRRLLACSVAVALAAAAATSSAQQPDPERPGSVEFTRAAKRITIQPGKLATWRSPNIGEVQNISLVAGGYEMIYLVRPKTHACLVEAYAAWVAMRLTDCANGKRVPYVRFRMANADIHPVEVIVRLRGRR